MKLSRIVGVALFGVLFLPLPVVQAQPDLTPGTVGQIMNLARKQSWSRDVEERRAAAERYYQLSREFSLAVTSLRRLLKDADEEVRLKAAKALANMGSASWLALDDLINVLRFDKSALVRVEAANALGRVAVTPKSAEKAVPALVNAMKFDKDTHVRWAACGVFRILGPLGKDAAEEILQKMLDPEDAKTAELARYSFMAVVGPECKKFIPSLIELQKKGIDNQGVECAVLVSLGKIGVSDDTVLPVLIEALKRRNPKNPLSRAAAAVGLGEIGPRAKPAVPHLVEALQESAKLDIENPKNIWNSVFNALEKIGPDSKTLALAKRIAEDPQVHRFIRERARDFISNNEKDR